MSIANIIYKYVVKGLAKNEGGITQLPTTQKITQAMEGIFQRLRDSGLNPVSAKKLIQNEDDLKRTLSEIDQAEIMEIKRRKDAAEGIETVMDKMNRGIPLNPSDQAKIEGAGMKTALDAFKGFEPKVIQGGKAAETEAEMLARMNRQNKESVERIKDKKAVEESLQKLEDSKKPQKTLQDLLDDYDGDPDAMADGGLATMFRKK